MPFIIYTHESMIQMSIRAF